MSSFAINHFGSTPLHEADLMAEQMTSLGASIIRLYAKHMLELAMACLYKQASNRATLSRQIIIGGA